MRDIRAAAIVLGALAVGACQRAGEPGASTGPAPAAPVVVAVATQSDSPIALRTIGSVQSPSLVMLRPQVSARVLELAASEGTDVKPGDVIARLDARPFEVALAEARANETQARAMADDAHRLVARLAGADATSAVAQRDIESARAKATAADAEVLSSQARVERAALDLGYCTIAAPFAGRLGEFLVRPGSIVKVNDTDLIELVQFDPIEVSCAVPEERIGAVREALKAGAVTVEAWPSGEDGAGIPGTLTFVDSKVDPATGTIRLKATFANPERRLWPGRFATVSILLGYDRDSVTAPEAAVQQSQAGTMVWVVKGDQTVEARPVRVRRTADGRSVIESGLAAGETVVTEGQLRLAPGAKVKVKDAPGGTAPGTGDAR